MTDVKKRRRRPSWATWILVTFVVLVCAFLATSYFYRQSVGSAELDRGIGSYSTEHPKWISESKSIESDRPVRVLSLDAGGIRGILELHILAELEKQTSQPVSELFDLIVGTSTGSVIGASLLLPGEDGGPKFSAQEVLDSYATQIELFAQSPWYHPILTLNGWIGPHYITQHGREWVIGHFGDALLTDLRGELVVAAVDLNTLQPRFISSRRLPGRTKDEQARNYFVGDVILAATAAPTLVPPMLLRDVTGKESFTALDGGLFAYNPAPLAVSEAILRFPGRPIILLTLGTGAVDEGFQGEETCAWGMGQWATVVEPLSINPRARFSNRILKTVAGREGNLLIEYLRINPPIPGSLKHSLFASEKSVVDLDRIGRESVKTHSDDIKAFGKKLIEQ